MQAPAAKGIKKAARQEQLNCIRSLNDFILIPAHPGISRPLWLTYNRYRRL